MVGASQLLHRLTSVARFDLDHEWEPPVSDPRVLDVQVNDLNRFPWSYKRYSGPLTSVALPRNLPATTAPSATVLAGTAVVPPHSLDLAHLARLLFLSAGVVRTSDRPYGTYLFRASGSAGGRFPLEVYVAAPPGTVEGLAAGVYFYEPLAHALIRVGPPPLGDGGASIILTGVPWRTGWRYRERGYRHVYWDAGTVVGQLLAAADSGGVPADLYTCFPDEVVAALVGADRVHEWPVAVAALGGPPPALEPGGQADGGGRVDAAPLEFPLVTATQRAGDGHVLGRPWDRGEEVRDLDFSAGATPSVEAVIRLRGSQRLMRADGRLTFAAYGTCLAVGLRGITLPHRAVVHGVEGVQPGLYRWPDVQAPARVGDLREETYELCMQQALAHDAAVVVAAAADVGALGDRQYRDAHLAAGLVEGRLHLLAYGLGASASGMTFVDGRMRAFLAEPLDGILCTCIGVPEYRARPGGTPGDPVEVHPVTPRMSAV